MKTNVELEFISKARELYEAAQSLAIFWLKNEKELEELNVCESYPFSLHLEDLTSDAFDWYVALNSAYYEKMQK